MSRSDHPRPPRADSKPPELHLGVGGWTKCRSCDSRITFATTASGKPAPFVADPNGLWSIVNGQARYLGKNAQQLELGKEPEPRFTNHFANCPGAKSWRNKP